MVRLDDLMVPSGLKLYDCMTQRAVKIVVPSSAVSVVVIRPLVLSTDFYVPVIF